MKRRKAREYVLQFLYSLDILGVLEEDDHKERLEFFWRENEEKDKEIIEFAEEIILGTIKNQKLIDSVIQSFSENWNFQRIAVVERNILRFATFELLFRKDIPPAVTMNEAIELAKAYSSSDSASFINGILDRIAKEEKNYLWKKSSNKN